MLSPNPKLTSPGASNYRWYILTLGVLTNILVLAVQSMCMPVMFNSISADLHLNLVQIGLVWGIVALPGIVTVLVGGAVGDRFGPKLVLVVGCLLTGLAGALRGLAVDFYSLMGAMFLFGMISPFIAMITLKVTGTWFSRKQLGLASGVLSMGMAFGFLIGSLFSATLLTPLLGGWRNVLFFYGVLAMVISIPWMFTRTAPGTAPVEHANTISPSSLRQNMVYVARFRKVWLYGFALLGINGCVQGAMGYLPLYLRNLGWTTTAADGATAAFYTASLICVVPIALWSDRMGSRRRVIIIAGSMIAAGIGLLSISQGALVWVAVCLAGLAGDGFMAVLLASVIEIDGVGTAYAGTALGMVMVFSRMGALVAPSLGNSLAEINAGLPFLFWSALGFMGLIGLGKKFKD